jgi:putative hydrolase of the HAD superfamily
MKALLLDLDDTLLDTRAGAVRTIADFHATHGPLMGVGPEEAAARWQRGIDLNHPRYLRGEISFKDQRRGRVRELFARQDMPDEEADALFQVYVDLAPRHYVLFDDVLPFLERMKGLPMAIVTNGAADVQARKVQRTGLGDWTRTVLISEAVGYRKPQKEIFLMAAEALGVAPADCVMVGDTFDADYLGGKAAGMKAIWLNRVGKPVPTASNAGEGSPTMVTGLDQFARA